MLFCAKYGGVLTSDNLNGVSLTVDAFSDHLGNTTPVTVVADDVVTNITYDPETGKTYGTFWKVVDGAPWVELTDIQNWFAVSGTYGAQLVASTADDLPYQRGGLAVYYSDGSFAAANLGTILTITGNL